MALTRFQDGNVLHASELNAMVDEIEKKADVSEDGSISATEFIEGGKTLEEKYGQTDKTLSVENIAADAKAVGDGKADAIITSASGETIVVNDSAERQIRGLTIFGKSTQKGTPSPENPVPIVSAENPTVYVGGKNLASSVVISSSIYRYVSSLYVETELLPNTTYSLFFRVTNSKHGVYVNEILANYKLVRFNGDYQKALVKTQNSISRSNINQYTNGRGWILLKNYEDMSFVPNYSDVMLCLGDVDYPYESYKEMQFKQIPFTLRSVGDAKDELVVREDGSGEFIKRIYHTVYNIPSGIIESGKLTRRGYLIDEELRRCYGDTTQKGMSSIINSFAYNTDDNIHAYISNSSIHYFVDTENAISNAEFNLVYVDPIITQLTAQQVQAILALHMYKPTSTIWNDKTAQMEVIYSADTKNYIDGKLQQIQTALASLEV